VTIYERFAQDYHAYHGISEERAREQLKVLRELEGHAGTPIEDVTADQVKSYLANLIALGGHPNTVRKKRSMILSFYGWAFDVRIVDADHFMRMKRTRNPRGSTALGVPNPYERREIQRFWTDLDAAWPPEDERFQQRFLKAKRGRGQRVNHYGKQRVSLHRAVRHGMRLQVVAISHLALHAGLRRNEIFKAPLADIHYDNGFVVVRYAARKDGNGNGEMRAVPMTEGLGQSLRAWLDWRAKLRPPHDSPWLRLTGVPDADRLLPMSFERIDHLLTDIGPGYAA
jgi:site-specific recombinase XerD